MTYPVFIVCRDRVTPLVALLDWLESVGNADEVYLIDNDSTWPPLLEFYETTRHTVIRTGVNAGHKAGWELGIIRQYADRRRFIYTDPDLLPVEDCPTDAIERMAWTLDRDPSAVKVGFALKIDDVLPMHSPGVVDWESKYWQHWVPQVQAFRAPIDTTFALHSAEWSRRFRYKPAYRLPEPYLMRHLPWYVDPAAMDAEEAYYVAHANPKVSNWARAVREREEAT